MRRRSTFGQRQSAIVKADNRRWTLADGRSTLTDF